MERMVFTRQGERFTGSLRDITKTWMQAFQSGAVHTGKGVSWGGGGDEEEGGKRRV